MSPEVKPVWPKLLTIAVRYGIYKSVSLGQDRKVYRSYYHGSNLLTFLFILFYFCLLSGIGIYIPFLVMEAPYDNNTTVATMSNAAGLADIAHGTFNPLNLTDDQPQKVSVSADAEYPITTMIDPGWSQLFLPNQVQVHTRSSSHCGERIQQILHDCHSNAAARIDPGLGLGLIPPISTEDQNRKVHQEALKERSINCLYPHEYIYIYIYMVANISHSSPTLQCEWQGCTYSKPFSRTGDLVRHIKSAHLTRGQYHCPFKAGCKPFNRKDNLAAHIQTRHKAASREI